MPPRFKRKLSKFIRDPKLFFYDYFAKRIGESDDNYKLKNKFFLNASVSNGASPSVIDNKAGTVVAELIKNSVDGKIFLAEKLVSYLLERTCFIQTIPSPNANAFRIGVKSTDFDYIFSKIKCFEMDGCRIFSEAESVKGGSKDLVLCYFYDDKYIYSSTVIELDPWHSASDRIYTNNSNNYITSIDGRFINKTMYSPNPYFLQGEDNTVSIVDMLDLSPPLYEYADFPVDVVYTWVDGSDPSWRNRKKAALTVVGGNLEDVGDARFEQIDEIRYSLRSIASYFKFARNIFIVTDGQIPWWLNENHEKIKIVDHKDIFENTSCLPTFNSHAIEANLHRIPGLSENFIYMNDDVFLWRPVKKEDFFSPNGLSYSRFEKINNVFGLVSAEMPAWKNAALNVNKLIKKEFGKNAFSYHEHCPHALNKSVLTEMWNKFPNELGKTSASKFRNIEDVSPVSFFYHAYAFATGKSIAANVNTLTLNSANPVHMKTLAKVSSGEMVDFVCINDGGDSRMKKHVVECLSTKFPVASDWELA